MMDPKSQVSRLHGVSVLDASTHPFEDNLALALIREYPDENGRALLNTVLNGFVNQHGTIQLAVADAARANGNSPNTVLSSSIGVIGPNCAANAKAAVLALKELFAQADLTDTSDESFDFSAQLNTAVSGSAAKALLADSATSRSEGMLAALNGRGVKSVFPALPGGAGQAHRQVGQRGRHRRRHRRPLGLEADDAQADLGRHPG